LPELPELDNLFAPSGPIQAAQTLAAQTFGADETFFLANGSTCGIEAAVLAACVPGEKILVPRNAHRSVWAALVLSGAHPIYLAPVAIAQWDLAWGVTTAQVEQALTAHPEVDVVLVVSPSYQGVCTDVAAIAACIHARSRLLIVDEAHGPHLSFHDGLPRGALASGADVVIQSTHKVLSALTQASMLHVQGPRLDRDRLRQALQLTQSTSPNYLLLASLDAARAQMATQGEDLMTRTLAIADAVRSQLALCQPLQVLSPEHLEPLSGQFALDRTRLTVDVSALGITGFAADEYLHEQLGVTAELPTLRQLTFILSLGNTAADGDRLVAALQALIAKASDLRADILPLATVADWSIPLISAAPLTPRDAFFAKTRTLPLAASIGHVSADLLCPYPPGIPLLLPGEVITEAAIVTLQQIQAAGGSLTGSSDPTLQTLRIVDIG
jgi:arginine/lysine/ornithine decarboxylase